MPDANIPPEEKGGEVHKACTECHVLWPEDALDPKTGECPDCQDRNSGD